MSDPRSARNGPGVADGRDFAAWNEEMVGRYDIERYYERAHPLVRWVEDRRLAALVRLAAPAAGERLLEVGCGAGHVLERFDGLHRTGMDLSATMIGRTRRRLGDGVALARASAERLPFAAGAFDIVVCTEVLEHVPDPGAVIVELARVTRPDGRIIVSIPNEVNIDRVKRILVRIPLLRRVLRVLASEGNEWHLHAFDLRQLRDIVSGAATLECVKGVPGAFAPVRWVARLRPAAGGAS